jgi:hypothetical protein
VVEPSGWFCSQDLLAFGSEPGIVVELAGGKRHDAAAAEARRQAAELVAFDLFEPVLLGTIRRYSRRVDPSPSRGAGASGKSLHHRVCRRSQRAASVLAGREPFAPAYPEPPFGGRCPGTAAGGPEAARRVVCPSRSRSRSHPPVRPTRTRSCRSRQACRRAASPLGFPSRPPSPPRPPSGRTGRSEAPTRAASRRW